MKNQQERQLLNLQQKQHDQPLFSDKQPPPLTRRMRRPWRGIFLTYFLLFCGLLFFTHGIHRYDKFTFWDLFGVWTLSLMLFIPGVYFGLLVLLIELRVKGFTYQNYTQLNFK